MRRTLLLLVLAGCSTRPQHPNPYVPPETQYSVGSTLIAAGGLVAAATGASLADSPSSSRAVKTAGTAAMGAGVGMMLGALIDAVEVEQQRGKFYQLIRAFNHHYHRMPPVNEAPERGALPPLPEVPFNFREPEEDP